MTRDNQELTSHQKDVLKVIKKLTAQNGEVPGRHVLAQALGCSLTSAQFALNILKEKGYLKLRPVTVMRLKLSAKGRQAG